jgi:arsenate reductase (thioredoxin)
MTDPGQRPTALFVCVHNAGARRWPPASLPSWPAGGSTSDPPALCPPTRSTRSQSPPWPKSASTSPASPEILTTDAVRAADVVITMGCGDTCPVFPGKRYEDWDLPDPAGQPIEAVRPIRDEIRAQVQQLVFELLRGRPSSA